jgi:hypothetical protein
MLNEQMALSEAQARDNEQLIRRVRRSTAYIAMPV